MHIFKKVLIIILSLIQVGVGIVLFIAFVPKIIWEFDQIKDFWIPGIIFGAIAFLGLINGILIFTAGGHKLKNFFGIFALVFGLFIPPLGGLFSLLYGLFAKIIRKEKVIVEEMIEQEAPAEPSLDDWDGEF